MRHYNHRSITYIRTHNLQNEDNKQNTEQLTSRVKEDNHGMQNKQLRMFLYEQCPSTVYVNVHQFQETRKY